ncbi:MAG: hypothetical protein AAF791_11765, partial [Bacteroidota bacterium]
MTLLLASSPQARSSRPPDAFDRAVAAHNADPHSQTGRALDGLPLRLTEAAPETRHRPTPGGAWTLDETISEIERRGARLAQTSRGLRVRHAHRLPDLARNVARHERALTVWLSLREVPVPAPFDAPEWDA